MCKFGEYSFRKNWPITASVYRAMVLHAHRRTAHSKTYFYITSREEMASVKQNLNTFKIILIRTTQKQRLLLADYKLATF